MRRRGVLLGCVGLVVLWSHATAAELPTESVTQLRADIAALRAEQDRQIAEIRERTDEKIGAIEAALTQLTGDREVSAAATTVAGARSAAPAASARFQASGDFRLRYEGNSASDTGPARSRGVLRARLGARYDVNDWLSVSGRVATGDPDDPNSTDVTLSDFADDLNFSLDQAWLRVRRGTLELYGGKIPNPFTRTELVWDGDVNPDGVSASWTSPVAHGLSARVTGLYFLVNDQAVGHDSRMGGLQVGLARASANHWNFDLAAGYFDYDLVGIVGADSGDVRSNLLTADGAYYLSDFNLVDTVGSVSYAGDRAAWPLKLVANVVKNTGAATSADTGYSLDLSWGRASAPRDMRLSYGYSVAETDAVLAAFSHDNTTLATNYQQHTLAMDYVPWPSIVLSGTWYHYRLDDPGSSSIEWLDRVRINFLVQF